MCAFLKFKKQFKNKKKGMTKKKKRYFYVKKPFMDLEKYLTKFTA